MPNPSTNYSVIIPVYNGAETIESCLNALFDQDYPMHLLDIIIINDGSTDETLSLALRYPVRIFSFSENRGRIEARMKGAIEANHDILIFNDVRITPEREFISKINKHSYQPLIPNVIDYDGSIWGFARFFFILRCKLYFPYYPISKYQQDFFITNTNFDKVPKGTGSFICNRELWFSSQPDNTGPYTSDDTRILNSIVKKRPILRTIDPTVIYKQRTNLYSVIKHTLQRGPLFADYYLHSNGIFYKYYVITLLILFAFLFCLILKPIYTISIILLSILLAYLTCTIILYQRWTDIFVIAFCLPVVCLSFGLGILKWQLHMLICYCRRRER